jgi:glucokinase
VRLLAGDIGGTKTLLALYEGEPGGLKEVRSQRIASADHGSLEALARAFLGDGDAQIDRAAFAVAGPVVDGRCTATNLPWQIEERRLEEELDVERVTLLNDFAAVAHAVPSLDASQEVVLQDGSVDPRGPIAILGAGTGLGQAIALPTDHGLFVISTEGGHTDFAPRDELEINLLRFLLERHDRVSVERVVSGMGLSSIYEYVVTRRVAPESAAVRARLEREDEGAVIGELALTGSDAACVRTVEIFLSLYGAEAGNLALKVLPTGGVYVAGGIAPKLLPLMKIGPFLGAFRHKGRMSKLMRTMRVSVITEPEVGLLGARTIALRGEEGG